MATARKVKALFIGLLVVVTIVSGIALMNSVPTNFVVGIPQSCKASVNIDAPSSLNFYEGELSTATVKITNVTCGISYVRLALNGISKNFYSVGPKYITVISPKTTPKEFTVYFDIPPDAAGKSYSGVYTLYTNEGTYTFGNVAINVKSAEKPKIKVETTEMASKAEIPETAAVSLWYGIVFFAALVSLIFLGFEYFVVTKKHAFEGALRRGEDEIYKAIGVAPKQKVEFGSALKKVSTKRKKR